MKKFNLKAYLLFHVTICTGLLQIGCGEFIKMDPAHIDLRAPDTAWVHVLTDTTAQIRIRANNPEPDLKGYVLLQDYISEMWDQDSIVDRLELAGPFTGDTSFTSLVTIDKDSPFFWQIASYNKGYEISFRVDIQMEPREGPESRSIVWKSYGNRNRKGLDISDRYYPAMVFIDTITTTTAVSRIDTIAADTTMYYIKKLYIDTTANDTLTAFDVHIADSLDTLWIDTLDGDTLHNLDITVSDTVFLTPDSTFTRAVSSDTIFSPNNAVDIAFSWGASHTGSGYIAGTNGAVVIYCKNDTGAYFSLDDILMARGSLASAVRAVQTGPHYMFKSDSAVLDNGETGSPVVPSVGDAYIVADGSFDSTSEDRLRIARVIITGITENTNVRTAGVTGLREWNVYAPYREVAVKVDVYTPGDDRGNNGKPVVLGWHMEKSLYETIN